MVVCGWATPCTSPGRQRAPPPEDDGEEAHAPPHHLPSIKLATSPAAVYLPIPGQVKMKTEDPSSKSGGGRSDRSADQVSGARSRRRKMRSAAEPKGRRRRCFLVYH